MKDDALASNNFNQNRYWLLWVLATAGGWLAAYWISFLLNGLAFGLLQIDPAALSDSQALPESAQLPLLFLELASLFVIGAVVGGAQWLILRQQIPEVGRWPLFTAIGCLLTLFAGPYWFLLLGLGMGLLQWLILRNILNRTGWWSVVSAVAWPISNMTAGGLLGIVVGQLTNSMILAAMVSWVTSGAIVGAITGAALLWLLRENVALLKSLRQDKEVVSQ